MTQGENILEVEHVARSFGRRRVLNDVTFTMHHGEILGIVGENGSGKSTLLKILVGLLKPTAGRVISRGRVGYCPQELLILETLTVRENLQYFATAYGLYQTNDTITWENLQNDLMERFRFRQSENMLASDLSGGTKQKLNLSLALLHSPDLLILDEPYSGFDWETYLRFWSFAEELRSHGKSILVVSHFVYERTKFDRILELKEGVLQCV